jgi:ABC-type uncharacterized transport system involved in gliding motility auxiliary subunit
MAINRKIANKNSLILKKNLPFLVAVALISATFGIALFYIDGQFDVLNWSLASSLTIGGSIAFIILLRLIKKLNSGSASPINVIKQGRMAQWKRPAIVLSMLIGSFTFLSVSHYFANSINVRWDVTQNKQHTLSENTLNFIRTLNEKVELTALYVGLPPKYLQDLFKEYERLSSGLISTTIIDPIENIAYAAKFGNIVSGKERKVIVQSSNNRKDVDFTNNTLSEEKLTNAIARASRSAKQVYFLNGHGEYSISNKSNVGLATFKQLLADNNIASKPLMLGITQEIPDDCDVLIIAGPRTELTKKEETLIVKYLSSGGDALFLIEHTLVTTADKPITVEQQQKNPALNSILNQWGLDVQSDIVVDITNHVGDDVGSPATKNYQNHKAITQGLDYTFYVRPRSIQVLDQRRPTIKLATIVSTASKEQSWAETNRTLNIQFDAGIDTQGPVPISYVVLEEHAEENNAKTADTSTVSDTRIIVFTDADFLTNVYINQYSNAQMGLNIVNWLAELDYQVFLSAKEIKVERLDLTSKQKRQVIVILFLLPFFFLIIGGVVWLRSRVH